MWKVLKQSIKCLIVIVIFIFWSWQFYIYYSSSRLHSKTWKKIILLIYAITVTVCYMVNRSYSMISPFWTFNSMWFLWSLNHPAISTLHPYRPESSSLTFSIVKETSPFSRSPRSWYLLDSSESLLTFATSVEISWLLHFEFGRSPRPQHIGTIPSLVTSYLHGRVTLFPTVPDTRSHSATVKLQKKKEEIKSKSYLYSIPFSNA